MPYSDLAPPFVLPDCEDARTEVKRDSIYAEMGGVVFCTQFKPSTGRPPGIYALWKDTCENRQLAGDRDHNWCMRCMAGYPILNGKEQQDLFGDGLDEHARRTKALHLGY